MKVQSIVSGVNYKLLGLKDGDGGEEGEKPPANSKMTSLLSSQSVSKPVSPNFKGDIKNILAKGTLGEALDVFDKNMAKAGNKLEILDIYHDAAIAFANRVFAAINLNDKREAGMFVNAMRVVCENPKVSSTLRDTSFGGQVVRFIEMMETELFGKKMPPMQAVLA